MLELSHALVQAVAVLVLGAVVGHVKALTVARVARHTTPKVEEFSDRVVPEPHLVAAASSTRNSATTTVGRDTPVDRGQAGPDSVTDGAAPGPVPSGLSPTAGWVGTVLGRVALLVLTVALGLRTIAVGHAPYSNQYEFAVAFSWGMLVAYAVAEYRYRVRTLALAVLPVVVAMLLYARAVGAEANPLMPALQNRWLLTVHVAAAVLAYGAAAVAFGAAALYLLRHRLTWRALPSAEVLDDLGYRAAITAYPLMTVMLILGAVWADIAWGTYWNWDPKETAALTTWLIYGGYLHARVARGWRGKRAAWLLVVGFVAVLFTYFGNLFFGGLHAYA
ncbi:MAG: c-type cytochrome biogenesis protein CcsB [Dermatophilaceae bacterium]|nr:c-type cytochrome biogenesis protein CcsB [Actinomycetales bacterium]MBP8881629.1 c-type cytochrome biogenesis protein CcsB [Dermatophilaceae bacterium]MBP9919134.1 c-type cytochrome biogenesis protein CcsB [Dermatophilaceae bacterium]